MTDGDSQIPGQQRLEPVAEADSILDALPADLRDDPRAQIIAQRVVMEYEERIVSPLPPPRVMRQYEEVSPGLTERFVEEWARQANHRREMERRWLSASIGRAARGQTYAFLIALAGLGGGTYTISTGHSAAGFTVIGSALTPIIGAFLWSQFAQRKELKEKWDGTDGDHGVPGDSRVRGEVEATSAERNG